MPRRFGGKPAAHRSARELVRITFFKAKFRYKGKRAFNCEREAKFKMLRFVRQHRELGRSAECELKLRKSVAEQFGQETGVAYQQNPRGAGRKFPRGKGCPEFQSQLASGICVIIKEAGFNHAMLAVKRRAVLEDL